MLKCVNHQLDGVVFQDTEHVTLCFSFACIFQSGCLVEFVVFERILEIAKFDIFDRKPVKQRGKRIVVGTLAVIDNFSQVQVDSGTALASRVRTSTTPAQIINTTPAHSTMDSVSRGRNKAALTTATTTSDIISNPKRPGAIR